jgi:serine/threonine protein phosphatase 1
MVTEGLAPALMPAGQRIYAVGDVHGCATRLAALHRAIAEDLAARPVAAPLLVHLGDYIDRGPDSAGVVARLRHGPPPGLLPGLAAVNLRGNHEAMMLRALAAGGDEPALQWLDNGGAEALASWGLSPHAQAATWRRLLPPGTEAFLAGLPLWHRVGPYVFVHAGLRPGVALAAQTPEDMMWIRAPFLGHAGPLGIPDAPGIVVVHGHTPAPAPVVTAHRIGLDTGAVMGGALTCGVLEADRLRFLSA